MSKLKPYKTQTNHKLQTPTQALRALAMGTAVLLASSGAAAHTHNTNIKTSSTKAAFSLSSSDIKPNSTLGAQLVFNSFGCTGDNKSPQLSWANVPTGTQSFAITVYDPDAPTGSGWWHWTAFNIPAEITSLVQNASQTALPKGVVQGRTDFGNSQFGGACPPVGDKPHRYIFTVWALNTKQLPLDENASGALVGYYLNSHKLATAQLVAYYGRSK